MSKEAVREPVGPSQAHKEWLEAQEVEANRELTELINAGRAKAAEDFANSEQGICTEENKEAERIMRLPTLAALKALEKRQERIDATPPTFPAQPSGRN